MAMFDVIKYEGNGSTLVYKYPNEDFNTKSQLVVQQSQEAIFFSRGALADYFTEPGTYTLNTKNIPIICKLVNLPFGKESPFHATVFFIDKTERMNIKWGVGNIPFVEPEFELPMTIGVCGEYSFKIGDAIKFIEKVLGTVGQYEDYQVVGFVEKFVQQKVTAYMAQYFQDNSINLFTIETQLVELSEMLQEALDNDFFDYGIELTKYIITSISKHEDTQEYKTYYAFRTQSVEQAKISMGEKLSSAQIEADARLAELQKQNAVKLQGYDLQLQKNQELTNLELEAKRGEIEALKMEQQMIAEAKGLAAQGITKAQMEAYEVAKLTAQNEGAGNFVSTGMGMGMGIATMGAAASAVGGLYNDALSQVTNTFNAQQQKQQEQADFSAGGMDFGENTGLGSAQKETPVEDAKAKRKARLLELKDLLEDGIIDEEEYKVKKTEILNQI